MSKYVDAEKLKAMLKERQEEKDYREVVWLIDSLQQEQPEVDLEVIVLTDELGTAPIYKIAFGHIVDVERCIDYNGWNCPGVKYWMPCPKIPEEYD